MATLKEMIAQGPVGSVSKNGEKWRLCYDTHVKKFYIEHVMSSVEPDNVQQSATIKKYDVASWDGPGAAGIPEAKERLLKRVDS